MDSYDIDLSYDPDSNDLQSTAQLAGTVTSADGLTQFNLDLQPTMDVTAVTVNGADANFSHDDAELVIIPAALLQPGATFAVEVSLRGATSGGPGCSRRCTGRRLVPHGLRRGLRRR